MAEACMNRKAMAEHLLLLCWPWPCMVASRPHASSCVLAGVLGHHHGPERWATFMAQKSALAQKRPHYHGPEKRGVLGHHHGPEKRLGNTSLLADFRLDPSVLPPPPWWLLPPFSLISASTRLSFQLIPLVPVASSWTGTSTHAAQTQAGTTRAGTQRHVGLFARACTETSMHAAQTQARTQHKPP